MKRRKLRLTQKILKDYFNKSEVVMEEYLAQKKVPLGLTFEDVFEMYINLMKGANNDEFYVIKEGERIEL